MSFVSKEDGQALREEEEPQGNVSQAERDFECPPNLQIVSRVRAEMLAFAESVGPLPLHPELSASSTGVQKAAYSLPQGVHPQGRGPILPDLVLLALNMSSPQPSLTASPGGDGLLPLSLLLSGLYACSSITGRG